MTTRLIRVHQVHASQPYVRDMVISYQDKQRITLQLWMNMRPTFQEFKQAMKQLISRKSPDPNNILFEQIKHERSPLQSCIFTLILKMWESHVPNELKDAVIITIFEKKSQCGFRASRGTIDLIVCARKLQNF
uniref:Uncharacterized protein n=1 Tax=Octopus bimaculoides TaxID=37653 RepID=A0A0L8FX38_OCTBM